MFTNEQISYFLKYLKKNRDIHAAELKDIARLQMRMGDSYGYFMNHVESKGYMKHDQASKYQITPKGIRFIAKYTVVKFTKSLLIYVVVPVTVILSFVFQFIWAPSFLTSPKATSNPTEIKDSISTVLSEQDSAPISVQHDTLAKEVPLLPQTPNRELLPKKPKTDK